MTKPKIVVTGANGQLGSELRACAVLYPEFEFIFLSKDNLTISESALVKQFFETSRPQYCINCAAYTAVDKAESEPDKAFLVNGISTGVLASVCELFQTKFIHISTDYVFSGMATAPYKEEDPVDPLNTYGASKLKGEQLALEVNPESIIIRTSWLYSKYGNNFLKTMMRLMKERENLNIVNDQQGSPTHAADLAEMILKIIRSGKWVPGIYHYSNNGVTTWYNFALAIKELIASNCTLYPIPTSSFPTPALRPGYSVFDTAKIRQVYNIPVINWKDSLATCIHEMAK